MADDQLDPDEILKSIKKASTAEGKGRLFIFFGMSAGVGKTYAMLKAAAVQKKEGADVVIGAVETHGRSETMALVEGLFAVPKLKIHYKGTHLEEMDLDSILKLSPDIAIVDELAHTNVPGSRHAKRWQDVIELLDSGIDVYTALNVQHIESRKEAVEQITGISIRETVPDSILERAFQIQLIDLSPQDLLKRLQEGKVYLGEKAQTAAENFFKAEKLTALREIALRLTAEKVDFDLQNISSSQTRKGPWRTGERLLVAISHSPYTERLIRATRRLAFSLEAPWIAVNVDTGQLLNDEDKETLSKNITLARELGAEVIATADTNIPDALKRIARRRNVTQIVIGRPTRRWFRDVFEGGTLLDQLVRESGEIDVIVVRQETPQVRKTNLVSQLKFSSNFGEYWQVLWVVAMAGVVNELLVPYIGYRAVGFVFLLAVLGLSLFVSLGPIVFGAVLSLLIWDYFYIPPRFTFSISQPEDYMMGLAYLVVAFITGGLTRRTRRHEFIIRQREERTNTLYEIVRDIANAVDKGSAMKTVTHRLGSLMGGKFGVATKNKNGELEPFSLLEVGSINEREVAVAKWAFDNKRQAGWSTDTLSASDALYIPMSGPTEIVGVMSFWPNTKKKLLREEENLIFTVARQLAVFLERDLFVERSREALKLQESEKLHQAILDSISHEIRTPLTAIMGSASALQNTAVSENVESRKGLTQDLIDAAERLNRVVENLLDMSRLSSGVMTLKKDWNEIGDLVGLTLQRLKRPLGTHQVEVNLSENLPLLKIDFRLMEQVLSNVLLNAATYSPEGSTISISAVVENSKMIFKIRDTGQGIPTDALSRIFEKFYRVAGSPAGGTGIGLTISKSIVEAHGGTISITNQKPHGAEVTIALPIEAQPSLPEETKS